ncbi:MAG: tetratricopeptide repeat protein [Acidobacteria bacterium]|nr:tetratricopeptide repeat protein [Acidobacteriota bacterium]
MAINRAKVSRTAEKLLRQGRLEDAIREYKRLLDDNPQDAGTLNKVGDLYRKAGQVSRAVDCYRRIAEQYRERGFATKAIAMFKKMAKLAPRDAEVREDLAKLYSDVGLTRDALDNLRKAASLLAQAGESERALELESRVLELCPDDWSGLRSQGAKLLAAGEEERAVATFMRAAAGLARSGDLEESLECCREAAAGAPTDPEPMAYMIRLMVSNQRGEEAVQELRQRLEEDELPHLQALLGEALIAQGESEGVRDVLQAAADSAFATGDMGYQESLLRLDLLEGRLEEVAESLKHLVTLLREEGEHGRALRLLCDILKRESGMDMAQGLLLDLCRQDKIEGAELDTGLDLLSRCLDTEKHKSELAKILKRLNRVAPDDDTPSDPLPPPDTEEAREAAAGEPPAATGDVVILEGEDGSEVDAEFVNEHLVEADVFVKYGLHAKAAAHLARIVERYPRTLVAHQRLTELYCEIGQGEACALQSVQLAELHRLRGEMEEARQILARAVNLQPDNPSLSRILRGLAADEPLSVYQPTFVGSDPTATPAPPAPPDVIKPSPPVKAEPSPKVIEEETLDLVLDDEASSEAPEVQPKVPEVRAESPEVQPEVLEEDQAAVPEDQDEVPTVPEDKPVVDLDDGGGQDGYFDLAQAIEQELSAEDEEPAAPAIVDDLDKEQNPVTGIREAIERQVGEEDHQTHYQLGIAFKEMEMLDEAIGAFQQAAQHPDSFLMCCIMLGLCFRAKGMPQIAEKWYRKGLDRGGSGGSVEDQITGLLYDLGTLHQEQGAVDEARNCFTEVYASNANYRDVAARLRLLSQDAGDDAPRAGR